MHRERNPLLSAYAMLVYAFLFLPIVVLIIFSFNDSEDNFAWTGFTLDWYPVLFSNEDMLEALRNTLEVALVAVVVSTMLGTLLGIGLARMRTRYVGGLSETLILLPMVAPEIIMGISLLLFFSQLFSANGSLGQISIAHITFCVSYVAVVVRARAVNMDPHIQEAARDLGASAVGAFWFVTLPLLAPAIAAGAMLAFALSFDDLIVTTFNAGPGSSTLPLYLYSRIKFGVTPEINAISTIIVAVTCVAILIAWRFGQTRSQARPVDADVGPAAASATA
ncbi:MAG TPA: ABC transporter permease [Candidatus Limnocylindrales bacterium]|jgi:spermidine/putrescine transport system permease protein